MKITNEYFNEAEAPPLREFTSGWCFFFCLQNKSNNEGEMIKMNKRQVIETDADLDNCIYFQTTVEVWFDDESFENGIVERFTEDTVRINGSYFFRSNCMFRIN